MATTADRVVVELEAQSSRYLANISRTEAQFNRSMQGMTRSAAQMERQVSLSGDRMARSLRQSISLIAVAAAVKSAQELADTWTSTANKLAAAGVPMEKLNATQQRLADLARETRSEFASTADLYAKLTRTTAELGATEVQVARATETINKAFKAGGASTQEQISSILQLSQALGSGLLQGDELRSIRENAPLLARAIAREFGTTVAGLKKLGAEGELTADRVFKAILNGSQAIDAQFGRTRSTIGEAFTALRTEAGRFLNELDRATGATSGISDFVNRVADDFDMLAQAVVVTAAVVGAKMGTDLARSLGQAAVQNNGFVRSLMNGTVGLNVEAEAARTNARAILMKSMADRDAARASVVATQQRINQLREEARAYQTNIALAEAQRAAAVRAVTTGRDTAGRFVSAGAATTDRNDATRAVIANRLQLTRVTNELAVAEARLATQHGVLSTQLGRVSAASVAMRASIAATSIIAQSATVAMRGLSIAMSFFGGPLGLAIMAVAGSMAYFATEAASAAAAGENAQSVLDQFETEANSTRGAVEDLNRGLGDNAQASNQAANEARGAANAYDSVRLAADNAAESIKYMTAVQREQRLEQVRTSIRDLDKSINGFNPFGTNRMEAVTNAQRKLLAAAGLGRTAGSFAGGQEIIEGVMARADATPAGQSKRGDELKAITQEYRNAIRLVQEEENARRQLQAQAELIEKNIAAPTLKRPALNTSNLITPVTPGKTRSTSGSKEPKVPKGKSPEELAAMRDELDLQNRINLARAAGAEELAQFLEDQREYKELVGQYTEAGLSATEAQARAQTYLNDLIASRETLSARERQTEAQEEAAKLAEDHEQRMAELRRENLWLQEQELQIQLEIAQAAGDSARVKSLQDQLDLLQRISEYTDQGGLDPEAALRRAQNDQISVNAAEESAKVRDFFKNGIRAALDDDLSDYFSNWMRDATSRAFDRAIDYLFNMMDQGGFGSGGGGILGAIAGAAGAFFGGGRAGGGTVKSGKTYRVGENGPELFTPESNGQILPNSSFRALSQGNSSSSNNFKISIDLTGANGDETIRRIAYQAAGEGAARALAGAQTLVPAEMMRRASRRLG